MGILVEARDGSPRLTVTLGTGRYLGEGTAGWRLRRRGTRWVFTDTTASPSGGIVKATITDLSNEVPRRVRVTVTGMNGDYPVTRVGL